MIDKLNTELEDVRYPPPFSGAAGNPHAKFQVYLEYLKESDARDEVRASLLAVSPFKECGELTIELELNDTGVSAATAALPVVWRLASNIASAGQ